MNDGTDVLRLRLEQDVQHLADVVSVDGADIVDPEGFEQIV